MKRWAGYEKGINLGGWLSQCDYTKQHMDTFITEKDIKCIAKWGLDHVRLPIDYEIMEGFETNQEAEGLVYIDHCIEWCRKNNLRVVLDLHKVPGFSFFTQNENSLFETPAMQDRFIAIWEALARRYSKYADDVAFELLNEIVEEDSTRWSKLASRAIAAIRKYSKEVDIVVGGIQWNSVHTLDQLEIPIDGHIIYNFHFYEPFLFTHQSASWLPLIPKEKRNYPGNIDEYRKIASRINAFASGLNEQGVDELGTVFIEKLIGQAVKAAKEKNVPLYCGEYGVIDLAPEESIVNWYRDIHCVFEKFDIGRSAWTYKGKDFGITDLYPEEIRPEVIANL